MRIQFDSLKYAKFLRRKGIQSDMADDFMSTLTQLVIFNLYSKNEVDSMLSQSIEKVFAKQDVKIAEQRRAIEKVFAKQDVKIAEQRREFDAQMKENAKFHEAQLRDERAQLREQRIELRNEFRNELLTSRRWVISTIITVGLSLAAYLSAFQSLYLKSLNSSIQQSISKHK